MGLHAIETAFPDRTLLGEPGLCDAERGRPHLAEPHPTDFLGANEPAAFQDLKVLQERRHRHGERPGELAHGRGPSAQPVYDRPTGRVGQRMEDTVEVDALIRHMPNYHRPIRPVKITKLTA